MEEIWKDIPDQIGDFHRKAAQVSNLGRVRWLWTGRVKRNKTTNSKYRHYKTHRHSHHLCICDWRNPHSRVDKLVLATFVGAIPEGMEITHMNGDKSDCRLENLTYATLVKKNRHRLLSPERDSILAHWQSAQRNGLPLTIEKMAELWQVSSRTIYRILKQSQLMS